MKGRFLFRIEDRNGEGPYQSDTIAKWYDCISTPSHPTPRIKSMPIFGFFGYLAGEDGWVSAFDSLPQLVQWIGTLRQTKKVERKPFKRLADAGFSITIYRLSRKRDYLPCDDGRQCVFYRDSDHAVPVGTFPLTMAIPLANIPANELLRDLA